MDDKDLPRKHRTPVKGIMKKVQADVAKARDSLGTEGYTKLRDV